MSTMMLRNQSRQSESREPTGQKPTKRRRRIEKKNLSPGDIISELEDDLLIQILSYLPTKDAARTGVLSKRWLDLWRHIPVINFQSYTTSDDDYGNDFCNFADRALLYYRRQEVEKFVLRVHDGSLDHCGDDYDMRIHSWITWAVLAKVKEMDMKVEGPELCAFKYPMELYTCSSLKKLRLSWCCSKPPSVGISWASLKVCHLRCQLTLKFVDSLISGSPLLESLELYNCVQLTGMLRIECACLKNLVLESGDEEGFGDGFEHFHPDLSLILEAPYLHSLSFLGEWSHKIKLRDLSSLISANIDISMPTKDIFDLHSYREKYKYVMMEMLKKLSHVTELVLGPWCTQCLPSVMDDDVSLPLLNCTNLSLTIDVSVHDFWTISALLQNSCKLKSLSINSTYGYWCQLSKKEHDDTGKTYKRMCRMRFVCFLLHLHTVKIMHDWDYQDEQMIALVRCLLEKAYVLEKMIITKACMSDRVRRRLLRFPRSSSHATILLS